MSADGEFAFAGTPSPAELAKYPMNDLGNAMRLIRLAGGAVDDDGGVDAHACRLLYQIGAGWIGFNGQYWDRTYGEELARRTAHQVAREVAATGMFPLLQAAHFGTPKEIGGWMKNVGSSGSTTAMLRQAQSYLTVEIDVFDRDPLAINCTNGTLKLRVKGERLVRVLGRHDPADRITKMAAVKFDPAAEAPLFKGVFEDSFPNKEEGGYYHRCSGYGATGIIREQAFFVCQGKGRDGKSTLLDAQRKALGSYAEVGDIKTFLEGMQTNAGGPSPDVVKLAGDVRFVVLSEPKRGSAWDEAKLKAWTSGSPITARDLNTKNMNFKPIGKLFIECNPFPKPRGDDDGFWRRIKVIMFRKQVPIEDVDKELPEKIEKVELPGVLNWLLDGVEDWLCGAGGGLRPPPSVAEVLAGYRRTSSPFGDWLEECCVWGEAAPGERTLVGELYRSYKDWSEAQGHDKPMSARAFGDAMTDRQVLLAGKDGRGLKKRGPIRLKTELEMQADRDAEPIMPAAEAAGIAPADAGGQSGFEGLPGGDYLADDDEFEPS